MKPDVDAATQAAKQLREAITEAHQLLKDIRAERRDLLEQRAEIQKFVDGLPNRMTDLVTQSMADHIRMGLESYDQALGEAIDKATARVYGRFDTLASIMLGERDSPSQESIAVQVRRWRARNGL